jgi:hypothetical protein
MSFRRPTILIVAAAILAGCYTTSPQLWETSVENYSWASTSARPVTIVLVDTRDETEFFRMEIPIGKQLSINFAETGGDDPVKRPAKLSWSIWDSTDWFGSLSNTQSAPPMYARRIDYYVRPIGEYAPTPPQMPMRAEPTEKPEWTTDAGGPAPTPSVKRLYQ